MYPPRFTTKEDVAHTKAAIADLFNALGKGWRKALRFAGVRHDRNAAKTPNSKLENR